MNNKIINPATGRAVNRYGLIGQQVLENRRAQCGGNKKKSAKRNSYSKSFSKIGGGSNQTRNSWIAAVVKARKKLDIKGFQALRKETQLYKTAKYIHSGGAEDTSKFAAGRMLGDKKKSKFHELLCGEQENIIKQCHKNCEDNNQETPRAIVPCKESNCPKRSEDCQN